MARVRVESFTISLDAGRPFIRARSPTEGIRIVIGRLAGYHV